MTAPDPDFDRFDAVAARMPDVARAVDAFADPTLRERAYYELLDILNPSADDGATLPAGVLRRLADATREEARDGEEFGEVMLRLLDELRQHRARAVDRAKQERWVTPAVPEIPPWVSPILDAFLDGKALDFGDMEVPSRVFERIHRHFYPPSASGGDRELERVQADT